MNDIAISGGSRRSVWRSRKFTALASALGVAGLLALFFAAKAPSVSGYRGVAELVEYHASSLRTERIRSIPVEVGQAVHAGEIVVQLDATQATQDLEIATLRVTQARAALEAARAQMRRRMTFDRRRFAMAVDQAELGVIAARARALTDEAELGSLGDRIDWWTPMVESKAVQGRTLEDLKSNTKVVDRQIEADRSVLSGWKRIATSARERQNAYESAAGDSDENRTIELAVEPLQTKVEALEVQREQAETRLEGLSLRSPEDGVVDKISARQGDVVSPATLILQIRATQSRHVFAYVSDVIASMVRPGMAAHILPRDAGGRDLRGHVMALGSGVRPIPDQALLNPNWKEFGQEVIVGLDEGGLWPGQVVDVRFDLSSPSSSLVKVAQASPKDASAGSPSPQPAEVPAALIAKTRVEPSGLAWAPELGRFLVVSDDTGRPGANEQAPWLLSLDTQGRFDEQPTRVEGIDGWNDFESITRAPDGTFYALASQTVSRHGHRPEPRTLLLSFAIKDKRVVATGHASLARALGAKDDRALADLGLLEPSGGVSGGVTGVDRLLNIEGMTWQDGALLLGLKRPLDPQGQAIVWRLTNPGRFLSTGSLEAGQLSVFAKLSLRVGPPGAEVPAGISELLALPDGRLVVLGVALRSQGATSGSQEDHSALFLASRTRTGEWTAAQHHDFSGLKAEGVALGPEPGTLYVVFDRDAETPKFLKVALPR